MSVAHAEGGGYYLPSPSPYPVLLSTALLFLFAGAALGVNDYTLAALWLAGIGGLLLIVVISGWVGSVISENRSGVYHKTEDGAFRWGMFWFITSEVVFFSTLFGVLFYERNISIPWLASFTQNFQHITPWAGFTAAWPTSGPAGSAFTPEHAWGIPALNTLILLTSGGTVTWGLGSIVKGHRGAATWLVAATIILGAIFLGMQAREFYLAYTDLHLTLASGVYGATFFILTGFHGLHVTLGMIMLCVIFARLLRGDFGPDNHFGFEAVSWYWHFVDVVWLMLFVFVYWL